MTSLKCLPSFIFLICLTNLVSITKSQFPTPIFINAKCGNNGSYTNNSTYGRNLNTILSSVSRNIDANGFYNASNGQNPDRVNVIALCRADLQPDQCRSYVGNASSLILSNCAYQRQAILWHEFCMVRYSDEPIFGHVALSPSDFGHSGENITTNPEVFYSELNVLLNSLRDSAAINRTPKKFAGSGRDVPNFRTVFAFEQCTPDITPDECRECLNRSAVQIRECCDMARGVRILLPSCYLRFETDPAPFYNASMVVPVAQPPTSLLPPPRSPESPGDHNNTSRTIVIIVVPIVGCLVLALCIGCIYLKTKKRKKKQKEDQLELENDMSTVESLQYDFGIIRDATNNFADANKLGQGGFGVVYKGKLLRGDEIAVKRLAKSSEQGDLEFKNEVALLARLQHRNLVRLLGFSVEGNERLLIYECVQNGSLDGIIFDPNSARLDWEKRYMIIVGVAKGILYLHEDSRLRIIHRDLKPSNILLDGEMNPKIADFGMARLFVPNESDQHNTSRVVGTYGYMAPEYVIYGQCSTKSDVFSFGILVLEIITGQKITNFQQEDTTDDLITWVWKNWHERTILNIIDPGLRTASGSMHDIMRCIHIGLLCVQDNAAGRPTMGSVVLMLSSVSFTMPIPSQPAFFNMTKSFRPEISNNDKNTPSVAYNSDGSRLASSNEVTLSEVDPR